MSENGISRRGLLGATAGVGGLAALGGAGAARAQINFGAVNVGPNIPADVRATLALDGKDIVGEERSLHLTDQWQAGAGAVQKVLPGDEVVDTIDHAAVA